MIISSSYSWAYLLLYRKVLNCFSLLIYLSLFWLAKTLLVSSIFIKHTLIYFIHLLSMWRVPVNIYKIISPYIDFIILPIINSVPTEIKISIICLLKLCLLLRSYYSINLYFFYSIRFPILIIIQAIIHKLICIMFFFFFLRLHHSIWFFLLFRNIHFMRLFILIFIFLDNWIYRYVLMLAYRLW